jgi:hypothetical protein
MVADSDPLSRVLQNRSQRAIPVCERGNLSNEGQAVSHSKSCTPELEGENALGGFLAKWWRCLQGG